MSTPTECRQDQEIGDEQWFQILQIKNPMSAHLFTEENTQQSEGIKIPIIYEYKFL